MSMITILFAAQVFAKNITSEDIEKANNFYNSEPVQEVVDALDEESQKRKDDTKFDHSVTVEHWLHIDAMNIMESDTYNLEGGECAASSVEERNLCLLRCEGEEKCSGVVFHQNVGMLKKNIPIHACRSGRRLLSSRNLWGRPNFKKMIKKVKKGVKKGASKAKDTAKAISDKAKDTVDAISDKAKDAADAINDKATDTADAINDKAKDAADAVGDYVADKAKDAVDWTAEKMDSDELMDKALDAYDWTKNHAEKITDSVDDLKESFGKVLASVSSIEGLFTGSKDALSDAIRAILDAVDSGEATIESAEGILEDLGEAYGEMGDGYDYMEFLDSLDSGVESLNDTMDSLGDATKVIDTLSDNKADGEEAIVDLYDNVDGAISDAGEVLQDLEDVITGGLCQATTGFTAFFKPVWVEGSWGDCDVTCGGGKQEREVRCSTGDDSDCQAALMPAESQQCNMHDCEWQAGKWGQCNAICNGGVQKREVKCSSGNASDCKKAMPDWFRGCNDHVCTHTFAHAIILQRWDKIFNVLRLPFGDEGLSSIRIKTEEEMRELVLEKLLQKQRTAGRSEAEMNAADDDTLLDLAFTPGVEDILLVNQLPTKNFSKNVQTLKKHAEKIAAQRGDDISGEDCSDEEHCWYPDGQLRVQPMIDYVGYPKWAVSDWETTEDGLCKREVHCQSNGRTVDGVHCRFDGFRPSRETINCAATVFV